MEHQLLILFAASLKARDEDGIRLCSGVKKVSAKNVPSRDTILYVAGFGFKQFRNPLVSNKRTIYSLGPTEPVRFETFQFEWDMDPWTALDETSLMVVAGVLVSNSDHKVMRLIGGLGETGYHVVVGSRANGGFNPYHSAC